MSKYTFNENYFDTIDTPEKAYWIGFIWCDGYNCKRIMNNKTSYEFKLSLGAIDELHLYKLKSCLNSNHIIGRYII